MLNAISRSRRGIPIPLTHVITHPLVSLSRPISATLPADVPRGRSFGKPGMQMADDFLQYRFRLPQSMSTGKESGRIGVKIEGNVQDE